MDDQLLRQKKKRYTFNPVREHFRLEQLINDLPSSAEVIKIISYGGISSIGFIAAIANQTKINEFTASTLRVGRKHLQYLDKLYASGQLDKANFVVGTLMKNDSELVKGYKYYDDLVAVCKENGWKLIVKNNHSKILLFDTDTGKYVLETSSNLNENPKIEQFSFEKNEELYCMYYKVLTEE